MLNNLRAPRFNTRRYRRNIVCEDLYERWKQTSGLSLTFAEFKRYWNLIADEIVNTVVEEPDGVRLGYGMGDVYVGYVPGAQKKFIDYKASRESGTVIYHQNWETNRKAAKIIYGTRGRKYTFRLAGWWSFRPCRLFKTAVSQGLRAHPERYKNSIEKR